MTDFAKVQKGITSYLDNEVMPAFQEDGWKRVVVGAAIALAIRKSENYIPLLQQNQMISALGVMDESGAIDVETLVPVIKEQLDKQPLTIDIPMLSKLTFKSADVDKLHNYIKSA